jgi:Tfp pilus assembly protein PilV
MEPIPIRARRRPASPRRHRGQTGTSLVEVLVFVFVVVPVVLTGAAGLLTAMRTSEQAEERQQMETALSSYGESLRVMPYRNCATAAAYSAEHAAWPGRWTPPATEVAPGGLSVVGVEYWDQATRSFVSTCTADGGAQRLTLQVVPAGNPDGAVTGLVVKRDPAGAPAGTVTDPAPALSFEGAS